MPLEWTHTVDTVDWQQLSDLYRAAPLGDKKPDALRTVFGNSRFNPYCRTPCREDSMLEGNPPPRECSGRMLVRLGGASVSQP